MPQSSQLLVQFVGPVRRPCSEREMLVDRVGLHTITDLLQHLGYSEEEQRALHVLVDGVRRPPVAAIRDADKVEVLIAIGGG